MLNSSPIRLQENVFYFYNNKKDPNILKSPTVAKHMPNVSSSQDIKGPTP